MSDPEKADTKLLDLIVATESPADAGGDQIAEDEAQAYEKERAKEKLRLAKLTGDSFEQDITERRNYANRIFVLICAWLASVLVILLLQGFHPFGFKMEENVLITAITGTTVNVLGIFIIVANYLFPKSANSGASDS